MSRQLAIHLLSLSNEWSDQKRRSAITSFITLARNPSLGLIEAWRKAYDEGRFKVDSKLIADIYFTCPDSLKITIAGSLAIPHVSPEIFRKIFADLCQIQPMTARRRKILAGALRSFLYLNPTRADEYKPFILSFAWNPREEIHLTAVDMLRFVDDLAPEDMARLKQRLLSRHLVRMNALNVCCEMVQRHTQLSPRLLAFCTSDEVRALARRIASSDRDKDARTCAYYFLKALFRYDEAVGALPSQRARKRPAR